MAADWARRTAGTNVRLQGEEAVGDYLRRAYRPWHVWRSWPGTLGRHVDPRLRYEAGFRRLYELPDWLVTAEPPEAYELGRVTRGSRSIEEMIERAEDMPHLYELRDELAVACEVKTFKVDERPFPGLRNPKLDHYAYEVAAFLALEAAGIAMPPFMFALVPQTGEPAMGWVSAARLFDVREHDADDGFPIRLRYDGHEGDYVKPGWLAQERWYRLDSARPWVPYRYRLDERRVLTYPKAVYDLLYKRALASGEFGWVDGYEWHPRTVM